jgi:hypothetical protein
MTVPQISRSDESLAAAGTATAPTDLVSWIVTVPRDFEDGESTECLASDIADFGHADL